MTEKEERELKLKRGNIKRMTSNYERVLGSVNDETDIASLDLPGRLKKLQEAWSEFEYYNRA